MTRFTPLALALLGLVALAADADSNERGTTMTETAQIARTYYAALQGKADFASVPMAADLHFESPRFALDNEAAFRDALAGLVAQVQSLEIRHQLLDEEVALTMYELDLGAPGGPIPMAERLRIVDGRLVDVQLIFDSPRLAPPAAE